MPTAGIVDACHRAGFTPDICAFEEPPVNAMPARLSGGGEVGLEVVDPPIAAALSMLWPPHDPSPAIASVIATARRCAERHKWLRGPGPDA